MITKHCPKCTETKPMDLFAISKNRTDGHSGWCKACLHTNKKAYMLKKQAARNAISKPKLEIYIPLALRPPPPPDKRSSNE